MRKKVSIIVPCYNAEKFINSCLDSVLKQDFMDWECLLINDGSTDNTLSLLQNYEEKDSRFRVFSKENQGLSATRNMGLSQAKGDYVYFLDSDDYIAENTLSTLLQNEDKYDIVTGITVTVNGDGKKISQLQHPKEKNSTFENHKKQEILLYTIEKGLAPVAQNRLYKKNFLEKNNLFFKNGILHEDELWFFETMYLAKNVKFIDAKTYFYRTDNSESITNKIGNCNLESLILILETIFERYYLNNSDGYKKAVVEQYLRYLKKLILDFCIREKSKLSSDTIEKLLATLKKIHTENPDNISVLSRKNEDYYWALNKLSVFPLPVIEKYFFKNPVNSIRKQYKLFQIKYLLK